MPLEYIFQVFFGLFVAAAVLSAFVLFLDTALNRRYQKREEGRTRRHAPPTRSSRDQREVL